MRTLAANSGPVASTAAPDDATTRILGSSGVRVRLAEPFRLALAVRRNVSDDVLMRLLSCGWHIVEVRVIAGDEVHIGAVRRLRRGGVSRDAEAHPAP